MTKLKNLFKGNFFRNVLIVAGGTAGAQLIYMLAAPFITRMYGPENYGLLGIYVAVVSIMAPMISLTYPNAIVLPKCETEAKSLATLSITLGAIGSGICFLLFFLFGDSIAKLFSISEIKDYIILVPFSLLFFTIYQVKQQQLIRDNQFKVTAKASFAQAIFVNASQLAAGLYNPISKYLIFIAAISYLVFAAFLKVFEKRQPIKDQTDNTTVVDKSHISLTSVAKQYSDFPVYRAPQLFINTISQNFPLIIFAAFFGPVSAGYYALAKTIMGIPTNLIGKSVCDVFYPKINKAYIDGENISKQIRKTTAILSLIGFFPALIVFIFGPELFSIVFGSDWVDAGVYARWLSLWFYSMLCTNLCATILPVVNGQRFHLNFTIVKTILRVLSVYLGYYLFHSELFTVVTYSVVSVVINLYFIFKVFDIVDAKVRKEIL